MGRVRPSQHRLPAHLPLDKSLEEVILARKMISQDNACGQRGDPQRGMLASAVSPASYLAHLPPESYTKEVSSRLGKRPRSRTVQRATPSHRHGGGSLAPTQQLLRPLTGVSPPSTAQSSFSVADFHAEGLRPMVRVKMAVAKRERCLCFRIGLRAVIYVLCTSCVACLLRRCRRLPKLASTFFLCSVVHTQQ